MENHLYIFHIVSKFDSNKLGMQLTNFPHELGIQFINFPNIMNLEYDLLVLQIQ